MSLTRWLLAFLVGFWLWNHFYNGEITLEDGVVAVDEPLQYPVVESGGDHIAGHQIIYLAHFEIRARVLSKEVYRFDRGASLAPVDLALGWGRMSDSRVLNQLSISQSFRFYHYRWRGEPPIPVAEMVSHSANMHLIPTSSDIEKKLKGVRVGQVIHIKGQLVEARLKDGSYWRSSLTRHDSGNGACELIRVESVNVE